MPIGHQRTSVRASSVQNAHLFVVSGDHQINAGNQGVGRRTVLKFIEREY
jgi:alpha-D-ribose 1-methylphosphonate 5-triphosphate synthase subunit PhnL